jgi:aromatic ring hydroxylase
MTSFDMDRELGTAYHGRFLKYLAYVQENDLTCDGAMTDPKGDRSLPPHRQADPDLYLHVVEEKADGIVVRGAKAHQTGAVNSHEIIVMPTMTMRPEDADYAVSFALPADARGITYIMGRQSCDTRKLEGGTFDVGNIHFGGHEALVVFDDVFVPRERMFMYKEHAFSGQLVERFAAYHRQSYACKVGVGDVLIGAAQDIAGGLMVTLPSEKDLHSPEVGKWVRKYYQARADVPLEHRLRMLRLIENLTLGTAAVGYLTESMHGAGSPQAQRIMIARQTHLQAKRKLAEKLCGIV